MARLRKWPELMSRAFFNTETAAQGTSAITVAVTADSTTVTLTGSTWATTVATNKHRFALSVSSPWYQVATRSSATVILLAQAYVDATDASTDFVCYRSHYSLASDCDRVEELWLHDSGGAVPLVNAATDQRLTDFSHHPTGVGTPSAYLNIERDGSGNRQILLGPETPDDVYRVEYTYRRKTTDDTFTGNLDESRWPLIVCWAKAIVYEAEFYDRHLQEIRKFDKLLADEWNSDGESETQYVRPGQARIDYPGFDGYENLLGRGRVADPS